MSFYSNCGNELENDDRYCGQCGQVVIHESNLERVDQEKLILCPGCGADIPKEVLPWV